MKNIDLRNIDINRFSNSDKETELNLAMLIIKVVKKLKRTTISLSQKFSETVKEYGFYQKFSFWLYSFLLCCGILTTLITIPRLMDVYSFQKGIYTSKENFKILENDLKILEATAWDLKIIEEQIDTIDKALPYNSSEEKIVYTLWVLMAKHQIFPPDKFNWNKEKPSVVQNEIIRDNLSITSFTIDSQGEFKNIKSLVSDIYSSLRIIDIKNIRLTPLASWNIWFSMTVWAYNQQ